MGCESVVECVLYSVGGYVGYGYDWAAGLTGHGCDEKSDCSSLGWVLVWVWLEI